MSLAARTGLTLLCLSLTLGEVLAETSARPVPPPTSPVAYFRELLAMDAGELEAELARRPEAQRAPLQAKLEEYASLPADQRELRLRATELRYFLPPLFRMSPEARSNRLETVPADLRELIEHRLLQWTLMPPDFQRQLLENDAALRLFSRIHPETPPDAAELFLRPPPGQSELPAAQLEKWSALSLGEQTQLLASFQRFFLLTEEEKARTLRTLSPEEQQAMERTMQQFESLPAQQRAACIRGFQQFALMPPSERAQFLKNAEKWQAMTPEERQEWRDAVNSIATMPPLPPGVEPVLVFDTPPLPPGFVPPPVAAQTN
jgi:hypothetical protein